LRAVGSTVESVYEALVADLPSALRRVASRLPYRLGLTPREDGGWSDYARLDFHREMPRYADEHPQRPGASVVSNARLDQFRVAHYCAGFFGLFTDRVSDGQATADPELLAIGPHLFEAWRRALGLAIGDPIAARHVIDAAVGAWRAGVALEQSHVAAAQLPLPVYMEIVRLKGQWLISSSACLLLCAGDLARAARFRRAAELALLAAQCRDDAEDSDEDERLRGRSTPALLGYSAAALCRAAPRLLRAASASALDGRFHRLATWLSDRASAVEGPPATEHAIEDDLAGIVIATYAEETWRPGYP
jgi:hypothetical protein